MGSTQLGTGHFPVLVLDLWKLLWDCPLVIQCPEGGVRPAFATAEWPILGQGSPSTRPTHHSLPIWFPCRLVAYVGGTGGATGAILPSMAFVPRAQSEL
jgi:hypothetical protein